VTIKHRIEHLENKHLPSKQRIYVIISKYGESRAEAAQRHCAENGTPVEDLQAPGAFIGMVRFVKPGNATNSI
jgi:hypothetical protein